MTARPHLAMLVLATNLPPREFYIHMEPRLTAWIPAVERHLTGPFAMGNLNSGHGSAVLVEYATSNGMSGLGRHRNMLHYTLISNADNNPLDTKPSIDRFDLR